MGSGAHSLRKRIHVVVVNFIIVVVVYFLGGRFVPGLAGEEFSDASGANSWLWVPAGCERVTFMVAGRPTPLASGTEVLHHESERVGAENLG
jgi:hypothetical protein